jgi:cytochrome c oxidase assembly protein subunit 15
VADERKRGGHVTLAPFDALWRPTQQTARRLAYLTLAANVTIVLTGGAVRLTGSGLGCPTWPECTEGTGGGRGSFVPHGAVDVHGVIEFGNRLLTFGLSAIAIATFVVMWRLRRSRPTLWRIALVLGLGIPAQALIGGLTVLTDLNPWIVAGHLLVSMALISLSVLLVRRVDEPDGPALPTVPRPAIALALATYAAVWVVVYLGTVVTGSGPHAGDADAPRNGLDPEAMSQLHTDAVFLLLGLTIGLAFTMRAVDAPAALQRAVRWLLAIELSQGLVGAVQYATDLPIALVALHLFGASAIVAAATWAVLGTRERAAISGGSPGQAGRIAGSGGADKQVSG